MPSFSLKQPDRQPRFDLDGFDAAIADKSLKLIHYRSMRCPGGLDSAKDVRRSHEDHLGCSNGFLFREAGRCTALFTGNSVQQRQGEPGVLAASSASMTLPRFYTDTQKQVRAAQFDRFFLPDDAILVETWEVFDHSLSGVDRMKYPVAEVVDLVSASGKFYQLGDFSIVDGKLMWQGNNQPGGGPSGRGEVCSVRYLYRPYWYVDSMHHDLRIATEDKLNEDGTTTSVLAVYQACSVVREYWFDSEDNDPEAPVGRRQQSPPKEPQFGR